VAYLIDTTILGRLANATDSQHAVAARAVLELHRSGEVTHLLTFNVGHFARMSGFGPGFVVVDPASV
jgi:hypothetical protein